MEFEGESGMKCGAPVGRQPRGLRFCLQDPWPCGRVRVGGYTVAVKSDQNASCQTLIEHEKYVVIWTRYKTISVALFFLWRNSRTRAWAVSPLRFLNHKDTTGGKTSLDEGSARRRTST